MVARDTASFENNPYCWEQHIPLSWPVSALSRSPHIQKMAPSWFCCGHSFLFSCVAWAYLIWSHKCYFDHIVLIRDFITQCPVANYQTATLAWHPPPYIFTSHHRSLKKILKKPWSSFLYSYHFRLSAQSKFHSFFLLLLLPLW